MSPLSIISKAKATVSSHWIQTLDDQINPRFADLPNRKVTILAQLSSC